MESRARLKLRLDRALEQASRAAKRGHTEIHDKWMAVASNIKKELSK